MAYPFELEEAQKGPIRREVSPMPSSDFQPPQNRVVSDYVIFHIINKPPCDDKVTLKLFGRRCYGSSGSICCAVGFYFYHQTFERWRKNIPDTGCLAKRHEFVVVVLSRNAAMTFDQSSLDCF